MGHLKPSKEILVHLGEWVCGQFQIICSLACEQCLWLESVTIFLSWSKREPSDSKGQWMITHAFWLSNTFSVAEWPCGSLLLLEWPCGTFTTPLFSQEFAQWLTLVTIAHSFFGRSGPMALCYSCVFTRVRPVAHSCYYCGWNGVAQWHFATPLFFHKSGLMAPALATSATVCGVARMALYYSWSGSMALLLLPVFTRDCPLA